MSPEYLFNVSLRRVPVDRPESWAVIAWCGSTQYAHQGPRNECEALAAVLEMLTTDDLESNDAYLTFAWWQHRIQAYLDARSRIQALRHDHEERLGTRHALPHLGFGPF